MCSGSLTAYKFVVRMAKMDLNGRYPIIVLCHKFTI